MVRKSERNKSSGSEKPEKSSSSRKSSRSSRRRKKSTSESEPEPDVAKDTSEEIPQPELAPVPEPAESSEHVEPKRTRGRPRRVPVAEPAEETKPVESAPEQKEWREDEKFWGETSQAAAEAPTTEEDKSTWKVQSSNGSGGEIQKLKICRQRLTDSAESSSSPAKEVASPKRKRYTKRKHMLSIDGADSMGSHSDAETPTSTVVEPDPALSENVESNAKIDSTSLPQEEIPLPEDDAVVQEADSVPADQIPVPPLPDDELGGKAEMEVEARPVVVAEPESETVAENEDRPEDKAEPEPINEPSKPVEEEMASESIVECSVAEISLSVTLPEMEETVVSSIVEPAKADAPPVLNDVDPSAAQAENEKEEIEEGELKQDKKPAQAPKPAVSNEDALQQIAKKLNERAARFSKEATEEAARRFSNIKPHKDKVVDNVEFEGEISRDPASTKTLELKRLGEDDNEPCRGLRQRRPLFVHYSVEDDTSKENDPNLASTFNVSTETLKDIVSDAMEPIPEEEVLALFLVKDDEQDTKGISEDGESETEAGELQAEEGELIDEDDKRKSLEAAGRSKIDRARRSSGDGPKRTERRVTKESKESRKLKSDRKDRRSSVDEPKSKKKYEKDEAKRNKEEKRDLAKQRLDKSEGHKLEQNHKTIRKIAIVSDDVLSVRRSISPASKTPSEVLFITNLVRPFTIGQLRELLARTGTIAPDGFYIDKIKSKCYVKYVDVEMAVETRHALHGVRWPVTNPRTLRVEFSSDEAMEAVKKVAEEEDNAAQSQEKAALNNERRGWLSEKDVLKPTRKLKNAVREWDMGKEPSDLGITAEKKGKEEEWGVKGDKRVDKDGIGKRRLGSPVTSDKPEPAKKMKKRDADAPAKLLDDLFKKTKATPCIYWLPLTAEQIAVKEEIRRKHMAEHQKRLEELKKSESLRRDKDKSRDRDRERERYRDRRRK